MTLSKNPIALLLPSEASQHALCFSQGQLSYRGSIDRIRLSERRAVERISFIHATASRTGYAARNAGERQRPLDSSLYTRIDATSRVTTCRSVEMLPACQEIPRQAVGHNCRLQSSPFGQRAACG